MTDEKSESKNDFKFLLNQAFSCFKNGDFDGGISYIFSEQFFTGLLGMFMQGGNLTSLLGGMTPEKTLETVNSTVSSILPGVSSLSSPFKGNGNLFGEGGIFQGFKIRGEETHESDKVGEYGNQRNKPHPALDISIDDKGSSFDLKSPAESTVVFSGKMNGFGNTVILRHGSGISAVYTFYAHLSSSNVKEGNVIAPNQVFARSGKTGNADGTVEHVHFETWIRNKDGGLCAVDPRKNPLDKLSTDAAARNQAVSEALACQKESDGFIMNPDGSGRKLDGWKLINAFEKKEIQPAATLVASTGSITPTGKLDNLSGKNIFNAAANFNNDADKKDGKYSISVQMTGSEKNAQNNKAAANGVLIIRDENGIEKYRADFKSGGWNKGVLPSLDGKNGGISYGINWNIQEDPKNLIDGMKVDGKGFWMALNPTGNLNGRGGFGIHPDGQSHEGKIVSTLTQNDGTQGCIGINAAQWEAALKALKDIPADKRPKELDVLQPAGMTLATNNTMKPVS